MFAFFKKQRASTALVNGSPVVVEPKQTLLQAALRQGIDFPHGCRVGGCATCKCKLVSGKVRELTEFGYVLSDEELDQGYILACQSVPLSDIKIEVDMSRQQGKRRVHGKIVQQEHLTHDITKLVIQLEESLPYRPGQYARLSLDSLPEHDRSFSFASAMQADAKVSFFIRKVPGGRLTSLINDEALQGQGITVEGPYGDFHLHPADNPLLLIAGGSGLSPIFAMLEDALADSPHRPVCLLFGARSQRDLYALDEIRSIAAQWAAPFTFVPVLSEEGSDSDWNGARGFVSSQIPSLLVPDAQVYLCGPPAMIDSATDLLRVQGVPNSQIYIDRFTTEQPVLTVA